MYSFVESRRGKHARSSLQAIGRCDCKLPPPRSIRCCKRFDWTVLSTGQSHFACPRRAVPPQFFSTLSLPLTLRSSCPRGSGPCSSGWAVMHRSQSRAAPPPAPPRGGLRPHPALGDSDGSLATAPPSVSSAAAAHISGPSRAALDASRMPMPSCQAQRTRQPGRDSRGRRGRRRCGAPAGRPMTNRQAGHRGPESVRVPICTGGGA